MIRNGKQYSLEEIIFPTNPDDKGAYWSHSVSLCGKGGTGKTHQFLNLIKEILYGKDSTGELRYAEIIPFYLELNDIDNVNKITDNVLLSELSKSLDIDEEQLKRILTVLNKQVILFADGLNEVNNREIRNAIANSICNIRADYKTRVILSSREDHSYLFNNLGRGLHQRFEKVEICDLTEEQINNYFEGEGISIRYRDIPCLTRKLLATAQGLSMYAELIKAEPDMILEFKTLGSLLQTYCDRIMQIKRNDPREDLSFEDALSYIAYYLVLEGNFQLNTNQLCAKLSEIKKDLHIDDDRISKIFVKHKETDNRERHEDEYEFTHQNFRDYYAALFLAKKLHEINSDNIYPILNKYFKNDNATSNEEILSLCSDFLDAESIQRVINIFVKEKIYNHSYTLSVLIRLFALMNQNNISSIKLDSLDLTNVSLSNYMLYSYNNNNCVSLINTKITEDTFLENGLQTASSTICHYNYDKKEYIYAFSASNALIYDIENNSWKCIRNLPNDGWVKSKISSDDPNNMVLGIDEYLSNEDKFTKLEFIEFKKHFQRIHKSTDCSYRKWLEEITNSKNKKSNAYFFGHSLALTDKDVILDFINNENIVTTIFYRNEKQYAELITNIVKIIGPDCLSEKVYGKTPSIIFKKQRDIIDRTHSEWEILNDRHLVWRIYTLNNKKIKELIERIRTKISVEDLTYFYNQRNVINLYHAIISNIDIGDVSDTLFEIAKKLYDSKSCELFHWEDWSDIDYQGEIECNEAVRKFVEMVNEYNFEQHNTSTTVKITFDDLNLLLNQIKRYNFDNKKVERIFDSLINKFDDENADTRLVWECIHTLLRKMNEDSRTKLIKKKEKNMDQIMKIRMKHICDVLDEEAYYRARTDDMAQEQSLFV